MIAVCSNPYRDENFKLAYKVADLLSHEGFETVINKVFIDELENPSSYEMVIVIGGDGTILKVAGDVHAYNIPIFGINLGTKGFMASIEPEDIELVIDAAKGKYNISSRMMLDVYLNDKFAGRCLNDAVVHGYGDCISLSMYCDGTEISSFSGDGIVLSTATGSTGYSMSAGGPIAEPEAKCIIVSPICAHSLGSRSFVIDHRRTIVVKATKLHDRKAYLSIDGRNNFDLNNYDTVCVKESFFTTKFIDVGSKNFFKTAYEKLS